MQAESTSPSSVAASAALDLTFHTGVLRRRWPTVAFVLLVVIAATAYVTMQQTPRYRSSVQFVVGTLIDPAGSSGTTSDEVLARLLGGASALETQTAAIESIPLAERARLILGTERSAASLLNVVDASITEQQVLVVSATSADAEEAALIATAFVDAYLQARDDEAIDRLVSASERVQSRLTRANGQLLDVEGEIAALTPIQLEIDGQPAPSTTTDPELVSLRRQQEQLVNEVNSLERQLSDIDASETLSSAGGQIIRPATIASSPYSPQPERNIALAIVLGLVLGLGQAYLRDHLDDAIRSETDIDRIVGRPILGRVPFWDQDKRGRLITITEPASPIAEAYRTLRTNLRFLAAGPQQHGSLLVSSPQVGEGKTTTAANLAIAHAKLGRRVLLVDADLRRPNLDNAFATSRTPGLSEVLVGEVSPTDALQDVGIPNLRLLPAGTIPPNPSELLGSPAMTNLISEFEGIADLVIIDAPPLLAVSDALGLAPHTSMMLLVIEQGKTGRSTLKAAVQQLGNVGVTASGVVLNAITQSTSGYDYSYYYREYVQDSDATNRDRRARVKDNDARAVDGFAGEAPKRRRGRRERVDS